MTTFTIEKNVPVVGPASNAPGASMYPFAEMGPGDSFLVPVHVSDKIKDEGEKLQAFRENARALSNKLNGAKGRFRERNPDANILVRTILPGATDDNDNPLDPGVRVYRLEDHNSKPTQPAKRKAPAKKPAAKRKAPAKAAASTTDTTDAS